MSFMAALSCVVSTTAAAQRPKSPAAPSGWSDFIQKFDSYADTNRIVGASAVFIRDGKVVTRHHYGLADKATGRRVDERTLFHWGSITKTITGIAVLQLRDRGQLKLDDPVTRWIPELRLIHDPHGSADSITIRMLLAHTSGLQGGTWPWTQGRAWEPFEPTTWNQLVAMMPYQQLRFKPGSRYAYSNPAFIYLARIVEAITGDQYMNYVQKHIFAPLNLSRSYFGTTPYYLAPDRSHGYDISRDSTGADVVTDNGADFDPGITIPNGGWNAPVADLATYVAFLTGSAPDSATRTRHESVLSRASLEEMWRPVIATARDSHTGLQGSRGLSFLVETDSVRTIVGHTGTQAGYEGFLHFDPARHTGFVMVFNTTTDGDVEGRDAARFGAMMRSAYELLRQ